MVPVINGLPLCNNIRVLPSIVCSAIMELHPVDISLLHLAGVKLLSEKVQDKGPSILIPGCFHSFLFLSPAVQPAVAQFKGVYRDSPTVGDPQWIQWIPFDGLIRRMSGTPASGIPVNPVGIPASAYLHLGGDRAFLFASLSLLFPTC